MKWNGIAYHWIRMYVEIAHQKGTLRTPHQFVFDYRATWSGPKNPFYLMKKTRRESIYLIQVAVKVTNENYKSTVQYTLLSIEWK